VTDASIDATAGDGSVKFAVSNDGSGVSTPYMADATARATLAAILAKLIASPATEASLSAAAASLVSILAKLPASPALDATLSAGVASIVAAINATQTVSGTVTANLGTIGGAATQTTLAAVLAALGGNLAITAAALPLPTGAATSAAQATIVSGLSSIDGHVDGLEASASSIDGKLTGVASGTKQDTGNTALASILAKLTSDPSTGAKQDAAKTVLDTIEGDQANLLAAIQSNGGVQAAIYVAAASLDGKAPALGQALAAASVPVVLPTAQAAALAQDSTVAGITTALGTDGTSPPTLPGSSSGVRGWLRYIASLFPTLTGGGRVPVDPSGVISPVSAASLPLPTGAATSAAQTTAQTSLTSIDAKLSPAVTPGSVTAFTATTDTLIFAANSSRKVLTIRNEGAGTLYVLYGTGVASATNYTVPLGSGDFLADTYQGAVRGIFASAGTARCQEQT
jgi:hypothetical protein